MFLRLNESEIIDAICVKASDELHCDVEEIDVKELTALTDGNIVAHTFQLGRMFNRATLDIEDIEEGIVMFLVEFHHFNPEEIVILGIQHNRQDGFFAQVTVSE